MPPMRHSVLAGGAVIALWAGVTAGALGLAPLHAALARDEAGSRGIVLPDGPPAAPARTVLTAAAGDAWSQWVSANPRVMVRAAVPSEEAPAKDVDENADPASARDFSQDTEASGSDGRGEQNPAEKAVDALSPSSSPGADDSGPAPGDPSTNDSPASA